jgi:hypothetical protein
MVELLYFTGLGPVGSGGALPSLHEVDLLVYLAALIVVIEPLSNELTAV